MPGKLTREDAEAMGLVAPVSDATKEEEQRLLAEIRRVALELERRVSGDLPKALICDLDGTIALMGERGPFEWSRVGEDAPNWAVIELLRRYSHDHAILIASGRSEECRIPTVTWLREHQVPSLCVFMRKANDYRKDAVVKQELYDMHIKGLYDVTFCLDDRNQSVEFWRSLGLVCFQVAPGDF